MLYTNENAPIYPHDRFLNAVILRFLPAWVRPNQITIARFCLVPLVLWFVVFEDWSFAVPVFLLAALTDALDGSLARIRRQITMWGTFADPVADKLLIGSVAVLLIARGLDYRIAVAIVFVELCILIAGGVRYQGKLAVSANWAGKTKMLLQCFGIFLLLVARWSGAEGIATLSGGVFIAAIVAALASLVTYSL